MRLVNAAWPTIPSDTAASAGPNTAPAACAVACDAATRKKLENKGRSSEAAVTAIAAATMTPRLARVASISAPAGVCARRPAAVAIDIDHADAGFVPFLDR